MSEFKVPPAKNICIERILAGTIEKDETGFFLSLGDEKIEKVCVYGVVVSIEKDNITKKITVSLDDGAGIMPAVVFDLERMDDKILPGDFARVIGKIRFFDESPYIACDIIRKVSKQWMDFGKKSAAKASTHEKQEKSLKTGPAKPKKQETENKQANKEENKEGINDQSPQHISTELDVEEDNLVFESSDKKMLDFISEKDSGSGVDASEILESSNIKNAEEVLKKLLKEGEIYEVRPRRFRAV
ncbi:MAG TPA: hypothetical protein ENN46_00070 [Candidatus Woesearchaeota archaeon]|nr:hypothetical protein [Candidatus Woesearchaeota archaeon]